MNVPKVRIVLSVVGLISISLLTGYLAYIYVVSLDEKKRTETEKQVVLIKKAEQSSVDSIESRIISKLTQDLARRRSRVKLSEEPWRPDQATEGTPVIVFCVYSSRLAVDIESAVRGLQDDTKIVLVVLHPKMRSLLRGDLSSDEDLLDSRLINKMAGIAHFAFSDQEGLYICHQNDSGFEMLVTCLIRLVLPLHI